jgi:peptide/nickel transport system substrate-binding protein
MWIRVTAGLATLMLLLAACGPAASTAPAATTVPTTAAQAAPTPAAPAPTPATKPTAAPTSASSTAPAAQPTQAPSGAAAPTGTLVIGNQSDLESGHPFLNYQHNSESIMRHVFDNLVEVTPDGKLVPGLAASYRIVDDKTIEFKLRQGVKFHDGEDFNADSVKFSVERMLDPETKSGVSSSFKSIQSVTAIDPYTVQLNLAQPDAGLLWSMAYQLSMLPPKYYQQVGIDGFAQKPIGTGPYKFVEWVRGDQVTLEANENYWPGSPKGMPGVKTVIFKPIPEDSTRVAALKSGQIQIARNVPSDLASSLESADTGVMSVAATTVPIIHLDAKNEGPTKDVRVRQALNYAIDVEGIMKDLRNTPGTRLAAPLSQSTLGYDPALKPYTYDPEKAKQLLAEAGFPDGFETKLDYADLEPKQVLEAVQAYFGAVGVKAELVPYELGTFNQIWVSQQDKVAPLRFGTWGAKVDPNNIELFITCNGLLSRYCNPKVDELWAQQKATYDQAQRAKIVGQIAQILHDDAPEVYLYPVVEYYGVSKKVKGLQLPSDGQLRVFGATLQ